MSLFLDIGKGAGLASASGVRPFLPPLLAGALARGNIGINFDRNRHGLVRNFVYTDVQARHIAVHSRAVLEALRKLYPAGHIVKELTGKE